MRRSSGLIALAVCAAGLVSGGAAALPAPPTFTCAVSSPSNASAACTYKANADREQVITVATLQSYTIAWVEDGQPVSFTCSTNDCRVEPARTVDADDGTTVRITVTQGIIVVHER